MAVSCTTVTDWIYEQVSKPVEEREERLEKRCKKASWWNPLKYLCWFARALVFVIRWVVVTVVTAVLTTVCHLIVDFLRMFWDALKFIGNLFAALFTWDKCRLQIAIGNLLDVAIGVVTTFGDAFIRPWFDRVQTYRLRQYVSDKIDERFADRPEVAEEVKNKFNVNRGVFGYKMTVDVYRMYVDSETRTPQSGSVPNLIYLHKSNPPKINLYELAGFEHTGDCAIFHREGWRRSLPRTGKKTYAGGGGGLIDSDPAEITREELKQYIDSDGAEGPPFRIYAMSTRMLNTRIRAAEDKGRQLGLLLSFDPKLKEVTDPQFMNYRTLSILPDPFDCTKYLKSQSDYLICELGRKTDELHHCCSEAMLQTDVPADPDGAKADLCHPVAVGVFGYVPGNKKSGQTSNLIGTTGYDHDLHKSSTSGVSFRAQIPEEARKYVLIHELGHYFGLTHVDGFDRIMVSGEEDQGTLWTVQAFFNTPLHGGPRFIHTEAKRVWNFILTNFPDVCIVPPLGPIIF